MNAIESRGTEAETAVVTSAARCATLLRSLPDPKARPRHMDWTAAELAAHLLVATRFYTDWMHGQSAPDWGVTELAQRNQEFIAAIPERHLEALADQLTDGVRQYLAAAAQRAAEEPIPWYAGQTVTVRAVTGFLLGELLVHGLDLARTAGRPWPIQPESARLVIAMVVPVLPLFVDPVTARGVNASCAFHIRSGPTFASRLTDGQMTLEFEPSGPVDCHVSADPVAFRLVSYGRINQWGRSCVARCSPGAASRGSRSSSRAGHATLKPTAVLSCDLGTRQLKTLAVHPLIQARPAAPGCSSRKAAAKILRAGERPEER